MPLVLHLGAPKCGSSALQAALSANPCLRDAAGRRLRYALVLSDGQVIDAAGLDPRDAVTGYFSSADGAALVGRRVHWAADLLADPSDTLVLSNEGWLSFAHLLPALVAGYGGEVTLAVYLRPLPDWMNAAWWQWDAWSGIGFERWFARIPVWSDRLDALCRHLPGARLRVRVLPRDVVDDFFTHVLDAPVPAPVTGGGWQGINRSLPGVVLRLYQRHRDLRPSEHEHALDFILRRALRLDDPAPWVFGPGRLADLLLRSRVEYPRILARLDADAARALREDERWWLPRAYAGRIAQSPDPQPIPPEDLVRLHDDLARATGTLPAPGGMQAEDLEARTVALIRRIEAMARSTKGWR